MKDIPGYEGLYGVTEDGMVWSYAKNGIGGHQGKFLKNSISKGYYHVGLKKNHINKNLRNHRLVAITYIPNPENKSQINHINGIKTDNRVENLEWNTASENNIHAYKYLGKINALRKPVEVTSVDGNFIKKYDSLTKACIENNFSVCFGSQCAHSLKVIKGHTIRYI